MFLLLEIIHFYLIKGIGALTMACIYGGYMFKKRGNMSPSVYLMHLRVGAQGAVVGCLTLGLIYTMAKEHLWKDDKKN